MSMNDKFQLTVYPRTLQGKGASRRLRREENKVPAVIYGGEGEPQSIMIKMNEFVKALENEAFFSHILTINVEGESEDQQVVIKDLQRHPAKDFPMHADFQRIVKGQKMHMNVPVHFEGAETAPGVKSGGILSTLVSDVEIICIPSQLPEYLSVDVSGLEIGDSLHLSDIPLPEGVVINDLELEDGTDRTIVNLQPPAVEEVETETEEGNADELAADGEDVDATADSDNDE